MEEVEVVIDAVPRHEKLAAELKEKGLETASIGAVAAALGVGREPARQALVFACSGKRPIRTAFTPQYRKYAQLVARLRDEQDMTYARIVAYIAEHHGETISEDTASRGYKLATVSAA
jgi:hypothetical protein